MRARLSGGSARGRRGSIDEPPIRPTKVKLMTDDKVATFAGTLAEFYDRYLVPLNFAPYAEVVVDRVAHIAFWKRRPAPE
jgi:hypothetical protein